MCNKPSSAFDLAGDYQSHARTLQVNSGDRWLTRCWRSPKRDREYSINRCYFIISNAAGSSNCQLPQLKNPFSYSQRSLKHFEMIWQLMSNINISGRKTWRCYGPWLSTHTCGKEGIPGKMCHHLTLPLQLSPQNMPGSQQGPVSVAEGVSGSLRIKAFSWKAFPYKVWTLK